MVGSARVGVAGAAVGVEIGAWRVMASWAAGMVSSGHWMFMLPPAMAGRSQSRGERALRRASSGMAEADWF